MIDLLVWRLDAYRAKGLQLKRKEKTHSHIHQRSTPQPPKTGTRLYLEMKSILGCNRKAPINTPTVCILVEIVWNQFMLKKEEKKKLSLLFDFQISDFLPSGS